MGHVAALVRSHLNGLKPFERTMERTTETKLPSPDWNYRSTRAARLLD